jgi:hypothetical protein
MITFKCKICIGLYCIFKFSVDLIILRIRMENNCQTNTAACVIRVASSSVPNILNTGVTFVCFLI